MSEDKQSQHFLKALDQELNPSQFQQKSSGDYNNYQKMSNNQQLQNLNQQYIQKQNNRNEQPISNIQGSSSQMNQINTNKDPNQGLQKRLQSMSEQECLEELFSLQSRETNEIQIREYIVQLIILQKQQDCKAIISKLAALKQEGIFLSEEWELKQSDRCPSITSKVVISLQRVSEKNLRQMIEKIVSPQVGQLLISSKDSKEYNAKYQNILTNEQIALIGEKAIVKKYCIEMILRNKAEIESLRQTKKEKEKLETQQKADQQSIKDLEQEKQKVTLERNSLKKGQAELEKKANLTDQDLKKQIEATTKEKDTLIQQKKEVEKGLDLMTQKLEEEKKRVKNLEEKLICSKEIILEQQRNQEDLTHKCNIMNEEIKKCQKVISKIVPLAYPQNSQN